MDFNLGYVVFYKTFQDLTNDHIYVEGDKFPFDDSYVEKERLEELLSKNNKIGKKLIRPKFLEDCDVDELKEIANKFQIEIIGEEKEKIIAILKAAKKEAADIKKKLSSKNISFEENATFLELKTLITEANATE